MTQETRQQPTLVAAYKAAFSRMGARIGRMLSGSEEASDIFQDAFAKLWGSPKAQEMDENEATALTATTARNMAIDSWRRGSRRPTSPIDEDRDDAPDDSEQDAENRERYEEVRRIIETRLPDAQRQVLTMRDIDGMAYADIAAELGIDETAVRMRLSRARKAVREIYESETRERN